MGRCCGRLSRYEEEPSTQRNRGHRGFEIAKIGQMKSEMRSQFSAITAILANYQPLHVLTSSVLRFCLCSPNKNTAVSGGVQFLLRLHHKNFIPCGTKALAKGT